MKKTENTIRREFLGWDRPVLHTACDFLQDCYLKDGQWDLDNVLIVLPSSLAGRRLSELLAETAQKNGWILRPPETVTVGMLPEKLYQAKLPFASDLAQTLSWVKVLREMPSNELAPLLIDVPSASVLQPWIELAGLLSSLHRELATDLLLFGDVADRLQGTTEEPRWRVLEQTQRKYLDAVHSIGMWDIQTARRVAIEKHEPLASQDIIVLAAVDLNQAQRRFMDAVSKYVTVLIGAPSEWQSGFDPHGALVPEFWQDIRVTIDPGILKVRSAAIDSAEEVTRQLALLGDRAATRDVTIGVPDESLIPVLMEKLSRAGVVARSGAGVPVSHLTPLRLLTACVDYLIDGTFSSLASLIRIPAVSRMLRSEGELPIDYLQQLDRYYNLTLLRSVNVPIWPEAPERACAEDLVKRIDQWLKPMRLPPTTLAKWSAPMHAVLLDVFGQQSVNLDVAQDDSLFDACSKVNEALSRLADVPESLQVEVTASEAVAWIQRQLEKERVAPPADATAVEMLGWLELALDDAPVLMLTGMHDGSVPESVNADAFLPNELRKGLGLMDNSRRYARDCYVLQTILHARQSVSIIVNQHNINGDPQTPSRLLLAVEPKELGARVRQLIHSVSSTDLAAIQGRWTPRSGQTSIPIPKPILDEPPKSLSVTDFKQYLCCPYRYYLSRIERLESVDDSSTELQANAFGNLIHDCLAGLKDSPVATSTNSDDIFDWLSEQLDDVAEKRLGVVYSPAVQIQIEQARQRLQAFAIEQAVWASQGWVIDKAEISVTVENGITVDGMPLKGRIDRVDFNSNTKSWTIWDYKTGDDAKSPVKAHMRGKDFQDLQLPLYLSLAPALGISGDVQVGYINLPKSAAGTKFELAAFTSDQLIEAQELASRVVRAIRDNKYWPLNVRNIPSWDPFQAICQTNVARRWEPDEPESATDDDCASSLEPNCGVVSQQSCGVVSQQSCGVVSQQSCGVVSQQSCGVVSRPPHLEVAVQPFETNLGIQRRIVDVEPVHLTLERVEAEGIAPEEWFNPLLIRASAGTGKTYQLANRMLRLLFSDQPTDHVLATTFTRKAAGEILHRVLSRLALAIGDDIELDRLRHSLEPLRITRQHVEYQLARLCASLHRFRVSTLDSFYSQLARSFSIELQLPPGWTLADPFTETRIRDRAIEGLFESQGRGELMTLVGLLFKGAAKRSIQNQVREVIDSGCSLFRSTDEAAWQALPVPKAPSDNEVEIAMQVLEAEAFTSENAKKSRNKILEYIVQSEWTEVLGLTMVKAILSADLKYSNKVLPDPIVQALRVIVQLAFSREMAIRSQQSQASYQLLSLYHAQLEIVKREMRTLTFDDIAHRLSRWMVTDNRNISEHRTDPELHLKSVEFRMDARIDHLLLDEFQDTSPDQWQIVKPFAESIAREGIRRDRSFFCVGDAKQAIYGWRGGVAEIFDAVGEQLPNMGQQPLTKSYRSSPVLMQFLNDIFMHLSRHINYGEGQGIIAQWESNFPIHETTKDFQGFVQLKNGSAKSRVFNANEDEGESDESDESLLQSIAKDVTELVARAQHVTIGVLARTNSDVAQLISLLRDLHIDASQEGGNPLTDSAAVELLLSLFHLADHPGDSVCAFHIANSPLADRLGFKPRIECDRLAESVRCRIDAVGYGPAVGFYSELLAAECNDRDQQRLEQLIQLAYQYDAMRTQRVRNFVEFVRQERIALPRPAQVRVMTIHQSKGLEFDAVFLSADQAVTGRVPYWVARYSSRTENPTGVTRYLNKDLSCYLDAEWQAVIREQAEMQLNESLSVFYVAMTRAKQALYLYASPSKNPVKRWGSVLHSVLALDEDQRQASDTLLFQVGNADWYVDSTAEFNLLSTTETNATPPSLQIALRNSELEPITRLRPTTKPSAVGESRMVSLRRALETTESVGAIIGTIVHRWFEEVLWIDDFQLERDRLRGLGLATLLPEQTSLVKIDDWLDEMQRMLGMNSVRAGLSKSRYSSWFSQGIDRVDVSNERRLIEIFDGTLLRGTIDRLVLGYRENRVVRAEILDYKTDAIDKAASLSGWLKERTDHHRPQLELYRRVICKQFGIQEDSIDLTLIMLSADHLISL